MTATDTAAGTVTDAGDTGAVTDAPSGQGKASGRRRGRLLAWVALFCLLVVAGFALAGGRGPNELPLHPDNPEGPGLQALHRVLQGQGVDIDVVSDLRSLESTGVGPESTVMVVDTGLLSTEAADRVLRHAADAGGLLVLEPRANTGTVFGLPLTVSTRVAGALQPHCDDPRWRSGDELIGSTLLLTVTGTDREAQVCFPPSASFSAGGTVAGSLVTFAATAQRPEITVLGATASLTNATITQGANAAVGLRLLGEREHLVWYIPEILDGAGGDGQVGITDVLPEAFAPGVAMLAVTMILVMFWRGRRLGPVVVEPLPAVIRSVETTRSRAVMYQRARDRSRSLAALQYAARRRLARRLSLPEHAPPAAVVRAVADRTGRPAEQIAAIVADTTAPDDQTLVRKARELRTLEEGMDIT